MKKIKLFLSVVLFTSFFNSCEDAYKIEQDGEFNEETITTVSGMQSYLNGIYAGVSIANEISFSKKPLASFAVFLILVVMCGSRFSKLSFNDETIPCSVLFTII